MSTGFAGGGEGAGAGAVGEDAVAVLAGDRRDLFLVVLELLVCRWFLPRDGSRVLVFWSSPAISWRFLGFRYLQFLYHVTGHGLLAVNCKCSLFLVIGKKGVKFWCRFLNVLGFQLLYQGFFFLLGNLAGLFVTIFISAVSFGSFCGLVIKVP